MKVYDICKSLDAKCTGIILKGKLSHHLAEIECLDKKYGLKRRFIVSVDFYKDGECYSKYEILEKKIYEIKVDGNIDYFYLFKGKIFETTKKKVIDRFKRIKENENKENKRKYKI